jgi:hypothetical protein
MYHTIPSGLEKFDVNCRYSSLMSLHSVAMDDDNLQPTNRLLISWLVSVLLADQPLTLTENSSSVSHIL